MAPVKAVDPRVTFAELVTWPDEGRRPDTVYFREERPLIDMPKYWTVDPLTARLFEP